MPGVVENARRLKLPNSTALERTSKKWRIIFRVLKKMGGITDRQNLLDSIINHRSDNPNHNHV
jgi:hypothetical protein